MRVDGARRLSRLAAALLPAALLPAAMPRAHTRVQAVRAYAVGATLAPGLSAMYLLATWDRPHRPEMLAVVAALLVVAGVVHRYAAAIDRSAARRVLQAGWAVGAVLACAALSLLDGGVTSPLGALVPFSVVYLATVTPPRSLLAFAALGGVAYGTVAVLGQPAPPGYPFVYVLGTASIAYSCLRQTAVLVSLRRRLADVVRSDPLTRCLNRRGFDQRLDHELAEAAHTGGPVTLVLADLDRFKEVNDLHGHQTGDEVLSWTGRTLARELGTPDSVARLGGDEFGAILTGTGTQDARTVVERLRATLDATVPASLGYATFPTEAVDADGLKHLADQRLYADKVAQDRRPPSAEAVRRACADTGPVGPARISQRERRRRSIVNVGWLMMYNCLIGLLYAALPTVDDPRLPVVVLLCLVGAASGLGVVWAADRVSRAAAARRVMMISAVWLYGLAVVTGVVDGGVASALGLGMLAPMPLVAMGAPLRLAAVMVSIASGLYVTVGVVVGGASGWYLATHLILMLFVSAGCAIQGGTAAAQRRLLTRLAVQDDLTGCLNRRGFDDRFGTALAQAQHTGGGIALLVIDLDGFKEINDTRGHAAGDELLRWVAATLSAHLDPDDLVGRLGGDEFVVLLTSTTDATACAERLRAALGERTPVSVGVAVRTDGSTFGALYSHADAALYADKSYRRAQAPAADRSGGTACST